MPAPRKSTIEELVKVEDEKRILASRQDREVAENDGSRAFHFRVSKKLHEDLRAFASSKDLTLNGAIRMALIEYLEAKKNRSVF